MYCKGEMHRGTSPSHIDGRGCHLTLDQVPAWVCAQCGEAYFEEQEVDSIQALVSSIDEKAAKLAIST
ncbi:MAG: YgiT-type zinc finger protein [Candidatus Hydrogenedentes bacterium]|nr:YgiT-type zinc finger protein [Candidatus Hydrogenedentota bacterium]